MSAGQERESSETSASANATEIPATLQTVDANALPNFGFDPDFRSFGDVTLSELRRLEVTLRLEAYYLKQELSALRDKNKNCSQTSQKPHDGDSGTENTKNGPTDFVPSGIYGETLEIASFQAPPHSIPIKANVQSFPWESLYNHTQFDVILLDPPWQLAQPAPTRGVAICYQQLTDTQIKSLPIDRLANPNNCWLFIWVINAKYPLAFDLMEHWGFDYVDDVTWVKTTVNRKLAKGHGHYLQHAKESCLVGRMGSMGGKSIGEDVVFATRKGQSQKPVELYHLIEQLEPHGKYLEIFGRRNNLRDYWVTIGNEL